MEKSTKSVAKKATSRVTTKAAKVVRKSTTKAKSKVDTASPAREAKVVRPKVAVVQNAKSSETSVHVQLPTVQELFKAGFHFGHTVARWDPRMGKYVFCEKKGIHIIDLNKTAEKLKEFVEEFAQLARRGPILVVGTKKQASDIVKTVALNAGMFYVVNRWPGGMLSNFSEIRKSVNGMMQKEEQIAGGMMGYTKKEVLEEKRQLKRKMVLYEGVIEMLRRPSAVLVIDAALEKSAVRESKVCNLPVVGLADTNINPDNFTIFVPGNDDATKAISLFMSIIEKIVKETNPARDIVARREQRKIKLVELEKHAEEERKRIAMERELELERMRKIKTGEAEKRAVKLEAEQEAEEIQVADSEATKPSKASNKKKRSVVKPKATASKKKNELEAAGYTKREVEILNAGGIKTVDDVKKTGLRGLMELKSVGRKTAEKLLEKVTK